MSQTERTADELNGPLQGSSIRFSEAGDPWREVPQWADFLIRLGWAWPTNDAGRSRVCLVSMPCDSAAAGLVTLGAMIRDFGNPRANDVDGH
jgi:hypothetical protein